MSKYYSLLVTFFIFISCCDNVSKNVISTDGVVIKVNSNEYQRFVLNAKIKPDGAKKIAISASKQTNRLMKTNFRGELKVCIEDNYFFEDNLDISNRRKYGGFVYIYGILVNSKTGKARFYICYNINKYTPNVPQNCKIEPL